MDDRLGWTAKGSSVGTRADILEALIFVQNRVVVPRVKWAALGEIEELTSEMSKGQVGSLCQYICVGIVSDV